MKLEQVHFNHLAKREKLLIWVIRNLLTDSQLDVIPPGYDKAIRDIAPWWAGS